MIMEVRVEEDEGVSGEGRKERCKEGRRVQEIRYLPLTYADRFKQGPCSISLTSAGIWSFNLESLVALVTDHRVKKGGDDEDLAI